MSLAQLAFAQDALVTAASFVVIFGGIIFFHELGHFAAAKAVGVRVLEFALGFGPVIGSFRRGETRYSVRLFPLGGFVRLAGMDPALTDDEAVDDGQGSFNSRPVWQRMAIIAAGPFMNFLLAFLLITGYYAAAYLPPTVTRVMEGMPAAAAGIEPGDVIVAVDGEPTPSADDVIRRIRPKAGQEVVITVRRGEERFDVRVTPQLDPGEGVGLVGIEVRSHPRLGLFAAAKQGAIETWRGAAGIARAVFDMVTGGSELDVRGPIGIISITSEAAQRGIFALLSLAIGLNLNLGLLNLLPIPVLDGGWLLLLALEGLRGRPLNAEQRGMAQFVGLVIIFLLMVFAFYQDVLHLRAG